MPHIADKLNWATWLIYDDQKAYELNMGTRLTRGDRDAAESLPMLENTTPLLFV